MAQWEQNGSKCWFLAHARAYASPFKLGESYYYYKQLFVPCINYASAYWSPYNDKWLKIFQSRSLCMLSKSSSTKWNIYLDNLKAIWSINLTTTCKSTAGNYVPVFDLKNLSPLIIVKINPMEVAISLKGKILLASILAINCFSLFDSNNWELYLRPAKMVLLFRLFIPTPSIYIFVNYYVICLRVSICIFNFWPAKSSIKKRFYNLSHIYIRIRLPSIVS